MTVPQEQLEQTKISDKELNFRALQAKYERALNESNAERDRLTKELAQKSHINDDEDDADPIDNKKLNKKLAHFGEQNKQETQSEIQKAVSKALNEQKKQDWIKNNADFYQVLQLAEKFAQKDPELAEAILDMPEGFERQKLVYKNIKSLGLDKPESKEPSIQEKVDANRKGYFYQPSGVGASPYNSNSDFSPAGQKNAYAKMQELKNRLRI